MAHVPAVLLDCARFHGSLNRFDLAEVRSAAAALSAVPFSARQLALEPLCGWMLSFGHIFVEEHLRKPMLSFGHTFAIVL